MSVFCITNSGNPIAIMLYQAYCQYCRTAEMQMLYHDVICNIAA